MSNASLQILLVHLKVCLELNNAQTIFRNFFEKPRLENQQTDIFTAEYDTISLANSISSCSCCNR